MNDKLSDPALFYGAQDGSEWGQLEAQMEQQVDQDEEYWRDAAYDARYRGSMISIFSGEKQRLAVSEEQIERFRRIAMDGEGSRGQLSAQGHILTKEN